MARDRFGGISGKGDYRESGRQKQSGNGKINSRSLHCATPGGVVEGPVVSLQAGGRECPLSDAALARAGDFLGARFLENRFGASDPIMIVSMHREEDATFSQPGLIALGFKFRHPKPNQSPSDPTHGGSYPHSRESRHNRAGCQERSYARDGKRADAHQPTEHSSDYGSGGTSRGRAFRRLRALDRADVTNISQVLRGQN